MAFAPPSAPLRPASTQSNAAAVKMVYIPDGLSAAEWRKIQAEEKQKQNSLGRVGPSRFKSRSFQAWQESGNSHLFPVDPKKVKKRDTWWSDVACNELGAWTGVFVL